MSYPSFKLILASASPRRRALLAEMGVDFDVHSTDTDESRHEGEDPEDFVIRLARDKANQAARDLSLQPLSNEQAQQQASPSSVTNSEQNSPLSIQSVAILASDTIVVQGERVFGKPRDIEHAKKIWGALSANKHQVMTAVCLMQDGKTQIKLSITDVEFGRISEAQMQRYWQTGEPQDKAGAYAIQGFASAWVKQISGSYSNVVGLPLREVNQMLTEINFNWL